MASRAARGRTSTITYSESDGVEMHELLRDLSSRPEGADPIQNVHAKIEVVQGIRQMFVAQSNPGSLRDAFRHLAGFESALETLRTLVQEIKVTRKQPEILRLQLDLLQCLLGLLSSAMHEHWGNRKYFRKRAGDGGWRALRTILQELCLVIYEDRVEQDSTTAGKLFGCLLAFALDDEALVGLFPRLERLFKSSGTRESDIPVPKSDEREHHVSRLDRTGFYNSQVLLICTKVAGDLLGKQAFLQNPEVFTIMLELWMLLRDRCTINFQALNVVVALTPSILSKITNLNTHNLVAAHNSGLLSVMLPYLLVPSLSAFHFSTIRALALALLGLGITNLEDAHFLYRNSSSSKPIAELLYSALKVSHEPAYIHFDLSLHGFTSIELPNIGRSFPPSSSSSGYTFSIWFNVINYDPASHTTLFGAFDASQTCFVLVYLEKDSRSLILQTSITSSRPSVRFKSYTFEDNRWYHLCLVHRRPTTISSSRASLFVDGHFVDEVKAHYPLSPPATLSTAPSHENSTAKAKLKPVQAFLGTPQDLASRLGPGLVFSQWRLASAYLFDHTLSDDLIAVHKELGPRYHGNYQDCLGSFQTYRASAALNLRNENLHPGSEEKSQIVAAIRSKASELLPESRVILNISPTAILDDDDRNNIDETQLVRSLSKHAGKNLRNVIRGGRAAIAINGAIPSINEALTYSYGFAVLAGDPVVAVPQALDDAAWRIGGCAGVGLTLLEKAARPEDLLCALDILLESIKENWRNSEAMERDNGFGVLANLLTVKLGFSRSAPLGGQSTQVSFENDGDRDKLAGEALKRVLSFVGYNESEPEMSVIINPLAYRILLVDLDIWRAAAYDVQKAYYEQFTVFTVKSKHRYFNGKRLARMRIVKKWLEALKGERFFSVTFSYFVNAFQALLDGNLSAETLRNLSLYITYAIRKPRQLVHRESQYQKSPQRSQQNPVTPIKRQPTITHSPMSPEARNRQKAEMSQQQMGLQILEMYARILCSEETLTIKKFARAVTDKWLLHLLADEQSAIVMHALTILSRMLVINGINYVSKFAEKTGGFVIMQYRLKRWWYSPQLWPLCLAILFGKDVAALNLGGPMDLYSLLATFALDGNAKITYPGVLPVITGMLRCGLKDVTKSQKGVDDKKSENNGTGAKEAVNERRSENIKPGSSNPQGTRHEESSATLRTVTRFLADMQANSQKFRDFTISTNYVQELLFVLYPIIVSSDAISPETELQSRESLLDFGGNDTMIRPLSRSSVNDTSTVSTTTVEPPSPQLTKSQTLNRGSSYVLVSSEQSKHQPSSAKLQPIMSPQNPQNVEMNMSGYLVEELLEMIIAVFADQILCRKEFPGIGLFMKVPPGLQEHQAYFESFILRNTASHLSNMIQLDQKMLVEPKVLTNLVRFATHLGEAVYEGWFMDGADVILDFLGGILEYVQRPDVQRVKSVRLCSQIVVMMRALVLRIVLLRLSEADESVLEADTSFFLKKLTYWQTVVFATDDAQEDYLKLLCYLLYTKLMSTHEQVRTAAANLWRILLVQKPRETSGVLLEMMDNHNTSLTKGFEKILELENESFLSWVDDHRKDLDTIFFGKTAKTWEDFVAVENRKTDASAKSRVAKRRERLKIWASEDLRKEDIIRRHEISSDHWRSNIHASENLKRQRALQDHQDTLNFNNTSLVHMNAELRRPCGVFDEKIQPKWELDQTEGRNRMRLRVIPDKKAHLHTYQAKRPASKSISRGRPSLDVNTKSLQNVSVSVDSTPVSGVERRLTNQDLDPSVKPQTSLELPNEQVDVEDGFEIVDETPEEQDNFEDKNRKVMRGLQRGDQVDSVHNISRIVGLEACEGLLIVGKGALYLIDDFFQQSNGEIVNAWHAPKEERDSYLQMISGRETAEFSARPVNPDHETRNWRWEDVLSISKRRFLFRDVAIEVFFVDGRSYLLTVASPELRNELHQKLLTKASNVAVNGSSAVSDEAWRVETLKSTDDNPQTFGSRLTNVFNQSNSNPATKRWLKGEISNFHYLMLVNTMAGRTFNDLTQYPVFPWVLADYTSEELDLTNPRSFRDLSKPMGCQVPERQAEFRERYHSFAEMGDQNSPPFHYGTHYSSAMIVTSYLIRLPPFVQSYLLLQGGNFDHPDRLFFSVAKAWMSASRDNMTDVRELIPEFYYLPDFLMNINGYDFGSRQGAGGHIDNVALPPWAKGDPRIFIAKHREALESKHVTQNLHQWVDLVFGHKQRGEAAIEATNVFHHLSYHGAKNLDEIHDPVERLATIGIIHNFGQTPHQVFTRAHPEVEVSKNARKSLDSLAETLTRLPFPLLETEDRVSSLQYSWKHDRLLASGAFRLNIPPSYDKYMEWGFIDGSVRFYSSSSKELIGLFEHIHQGQLSNALFLNARTLITSGTDSTISVWAVLHGSKSVDLQPKMTFFGHRSTVTTIAVSRSFSTLLSASSDGHVLLWDLNRLEFIREVTKGKPVECASMNDVTGTIMLCRGPGVALLTLNGSLLLEQHLCVEGDESISSCAFYEGSGNEYLKRELIFTGHHHGVVNIWSLTTNNGRFDLEHIKRMNHMDTAGFNISAAMTCILPMAQVVYTGDDDGRIYEWDCIQRHSGR